MIITFKEPISFSLHFEHTSYCACHWGCNGENNRKEGSSCKELTFQQTGRHSTTHCPGVRRGFSRETLSSLPNEGQFELTLENLQKLAR